MSETLTIRRVANGWTVHPDNCGLAEFTHVYTNTVDLARHIEKWAEATDVKS